MNGQTKENPMEEFAKKVNLTLGSVFEGYILEDLKADIRKDYNIQAEERARELGFASFKDFMENPSMIRYVKYNRPRNPNEECIYKAPENEKTKGIFEQQKESEFEKKKKLEKNRLRDERKYGAIPQQQQQQNYINNSHYQRPFGAEQSANFHPPRPQPLRQQQPWPQHPPQEHQQQQSQQQPPPAQPQKHWSQISREDEEREKAPQQHPLKQPSPHQQQPQQHPMTRAPPPTRMPSSSFGNHAAPPRYQSGGSSFGSSKAPNPSSNGNQHQQPPAVPLDGRIPAPNRLRPSLYCEGLGEPEDPDDFWDSDEEEELKNLNQQKAAERNNWPDEEEEEAAEESSGSGGRQRGGSFGNNNNGSRISPNQPQNARESATAGATKSAEAPLKQLTIEELNKLPLDERVKYRGSDFHYLDIPIPNRNPPLAKQQSSPPLPDSQNPEELGRSNRDEMPSENTNGLGGGRRQIRNNTRAAESEGRREYWPDEEEEYGEVEVVTEPIVAAPKLSMAQKTTATKTVQPNHPPFAAGNSAKPVGRGIWEEVDSEETETENEEEKAQKKTGANIDGGNGRGGKIREFGGGGRGKAPAHQQPVNLDLDSGSARTVNWQAEEQEDQDNYGDDDEEEDDFQTVNGDEEGFGYQQQQQNLAPQQPRQPHTQAREHHQHHHHHGQRKTKSMANLVGPQQKERGTKTEQPKGAPSLPSVPEAILVDLAEEEDRPNSLPEFGGMLDPSSSIYFNCNSSALSHPQTPVPIPQFDLPGEHSGSTEETMCSCSAHPNAARAMGKLKAAECVLLICDMQEKCSPLVEYFTEIAEVSRRMIKAASLLGIKIIATEQNPQTMGRTVPQLGLQHHGVPIFQKTQFSMYIPEVCNEIGQTAKTVIICGVEAHISVLHTALDFNAKGFTVHIIQEATSSRSMYNRICAYKRLKQAGIVLTTSETAIMELLGDMGHEKSRDVFRIIEAPTPDTGLLKHSAEY